MFFCKPTKDILTLAKTIGMALPRFFRTYKHKQFTYLPRYYDPIKERLQERIKQIEASQGKSEGGPKPGTYLQRGAFKRHHIERNKKAERWSTVRLVIIIVVLLLIAYYLLYT
jgi:hypothetical protein